MFAPFIIIQIYPCGSFRCQAFLTPSQHVPIPFAYSTHFSFSVFVHIIPCVFPRYSHRLCVFLITNSNKISVLICHFPELSKSYRIFLKFNSMYISILRNLTRSTVLQPSAAAELNWLPVHIFWVLCTIYACARLKFRL